MKVTLLSTFLEDNKSLSKIQGGFRLRVSPKYELFEISLNTPSSSTISRRKKEQFICTLSTFVGLKVAQIREVYMGICCTPSVLSLPFTFSIFSLIF
jgi:hypothetical protein